MVHKDKAYLVISHKEITGYLPNMAWAAPIGSIVHLDKCITGSCWSVVEKDATGDQMYVSINDLAADLSLVDNQTLVVSLLKKE